MAYCGFVELHSFSRTARFIPLSRNSLEPQSTLRSLSFFIAAEGAVMKNHSAAEAAVEKVYVKAMLE